MVTPHPLEAACGAPHISEEVELNQWFAVYREPRYVDC
jgi:hypothetical protein